MKLEMKFDDWMKLDLIVGEVKDGNVSIGDKEFELKVDVDVKDGDKIAVGIMRDEIVVPLVDGSVIIPESDIEVGSKVS